MQRLAQLHRLDEPLAARDDLERAIAFFVELDVMRERLGIADQIAARAKRLDDDRPRLCRGQAGERIVGALRGGGVARFPAGTPPAHRAKRAVGLDDRTHGQRELAPPGDVGDVAERADHRDARALFGVGERMRLDRHADVEERRQHLASEQRLIPRVVWVRDQRDARRNQLGPRGLDLDDARPIGMREADAVHGARHLAVLELRLRNRRAEVDVPEGRRFELIRVAVAHQAQERQLRDALRVLADRRVGQRPVDRQAEMAPELLERPLVLGRQPRAELDEVGPRDRQRRLRRLGRGRERRVVRQRRIAPHAVVVLHAPLGRQPVVVPAHGIEHRAAPHPLKARDDVGVRVREHMPNVQRSAHRRRRRVDGINALARHGAIERVGAILLPAGLPLLFELLERGLVGNGRCRGHCGSGVPEFRGSGVRLERRTSEPRNLGTPEPKVYSGTALILSISSRMRRSAVSRTT